VVEAVRIANKRQMYAMQRAGLLGNFPKTWPSVRAAMDDGFRRNITLRFYERANQVKLFDLSPERVLKELASRGIADGIGFVVQEAPPDAHRGIQGELMQTEKGLYLNYTWAPYPMRIALERDSRHAYGTEAVLMLRAHVDAASLDDLHLLLDTYPGCVVEFSAFAVCVGTFPHRRTIVWEVRHY
jgi:hypothetical protein